MRIHRIKWLHRTFGQKLGEIGYARGLADLTHPQKELVHYMDKHYGRVRAFSAIEILMRFNKGAINMRSLSPFEKDVLSFLTSVFDI